MSPREERTATREERAAVREERTAAVGANGLTAEEQTVAAGLAPFRARLDEIDAQLVDLLGERFQICREVAVHKSEHEIQMMQPGRVEVVRARYLQHGAEVDLPDDFTASLFDLLIDATCRAEDELMERLAANPAPAPDPDPCRPEGDKRRGRARGSVPGRVRSA